jgi:4-amino-4-deoxy-L-arabinose transferase-like glycosyltransferase
MTSYAARGVQFAWLAIAVYVVFSFFFQKITPSVTVHHFPATILSTLGALVLCLVLPVRTVLGVKWLTAPLGWSTPIWLGTCLALGAVLRLISGLAFPMELYSDAASYWELTQRLVEEGVYSTSGTRSYWPPGLPLFLYPAVWSVGPDPKVPLVLNIALFTGTAWVVYRLAEVLVNRAAGRFAVLILAVWPNLVLAAQNLHKELLVAFLIPAGLLSYVRAAQTSGRQRAIHLALSGVCLGFAALTQPSTLLLGFIFVGYELAVRARAFYPAVMRLAVVGSVAALTVLPWTVRNYVVHHQFIPINTAGGVNFYSANNPKASGGWIPDEIYMDQRLIDAGEVERNRLSYEKGWQWVDDNKKDFLKLMFVKHTRYLCCDDFAAFWIFDHPSAMVSKNPAAGKLAGWISDTSWLLLWLVILRGALRWTAAPALDVSSAALLSLPFYYSLAVHGFFQSDGKHHIWLAGIVALVASAALVSVHQSNLQTGGA